MSALAAIHKAWVAKLVNSKPTKFGNMTITLLELKWDLNLMHKSSIISETILLHDDETCSCCKKPREKRAAGETRLGRNDTKHNSGEANLGRK